MGKFIDITGEVFGKITVVRRLNKKSNGQILWECKCECGNHINKTRANLIKMKKKCCSECYKINLTGKRFGKLTVLEEAERVNIGALKSRAWKCKCDCGEILIVAMPYLRKGQTKSCKKCYINYNFVDLTGKTFKRLTVDRMSGKKSGKPIWSCTCECGNKVDVYGCNLTTGKTVSCGCYRDELSSRTIITYNKSPYGRGELHHAYNPNLSDAERERNKSRSHNRAFVNWSYAVKHRDWFTCKVCGESKSDEMNAHHLNGWNWCEEGRYDIDNGVTLCKSCHDDFHVKYGYGNNTREQFEEFLEVTHTTLKI